jgi:outer membrane immunogenic protein
MKKIMTLAALSSLIALSAHATKGAPYVAPKAEKAGFNWTGFYLGINGGYGWGEEQLNEVEFIEDPDFYEFSGDEVVTNANPSFNGWFGGGQIGYNYAFENDWLLGLEADIQGAGFGADYTGYPAFDFTAETEMNWFGTARAKVGYFYSDVLFYVTGGFAYGAEELNLSDYYDVETIKSSDSQMRVGWTAGAGIEAVIYGQLTAKAEYLYISFASQTFELHEEPTTNTDSVWPTINVETNNLNSNTFRLGLNYHF